MKRKPFQDSLIIMRFIVQFFIQKKNKKKLIEASERSIFQLVENLNDSVW